MNSPSVYQYRDPREYLAAALRERKSRNPKYSVRAWARQLGYANPAFLAQVLKGERQLHLGLARKISESLRLGGEERRYFELLVMSHAARSKEEREAYSEWMGTLTTEHSPAQIPIEAFRMIADWYHLAIAELTALKDFKPAPKWMRARLGARISEYEAERAVERLIQLKVLEKTGEKPGLRKGEWGDVQTGQSVPSEAIRQHHRQMIELALSALENQTIQERHFAGSTIAVRSRDLPKLRAILEDAHRKVLALSVHSGGDEVYQANTQLFRLTESPSMKGTSR